MRVLNFVKRLRLCSDGPILFHVYDRLTGEVDEVSLSMAEIVDMERSSNPPYPLDCRLETFDIVGGCLIVNCSM